MLEIKSTIISLQHACRLVTYNSVKVKHKTASGAPDFALFFLTYLSGIRVVQCCQITCLFVFSSMLWCQLRFPCKNNDQFVFTTICFVESFYFINVIIWCPTRFPHQMMFMSRWVSLVEQELPTLQDQQSSPPVFSGVRITQSLVLFVVYCRSLSFFFWSLCCLSFFNLRILISPLVSSNSYK